MNNSNKKKAETLGIPAGTASNRLRKMLLFRQLQKHGENICVRCTLKIEVVDDLSVEHIKPWESISAELFWDLDNVAFSHVFCNKPHRHGNAADVLRKVGPQGTAWCTGHQAFEPVENFYKNSSRWNGVEGYCKEAKIR